ncbi:hypothetical protein EIN_344800 [Entamoeba invadens IP1]|uniref:PX domain-containing protein n=1 Tax=Entamoeba invadens IP1 TaxID=370355 RepID=A0A0A1U6P5_ENTIV|nr:hypothetical protein EIN_344800 [Entamoeba invadens IP1]ELP88520.1 hypothetical protein EIN_344800 [Entamoeba invadens IP1]|eukprot:XP_004255291.1 hypothetical protein EIN_344800 [Entamoeba invadens IP1]
MSKGVAVPIEITLTPQGKSYTVDLRWACWYVWKVENRRYSDFLKLFELLCERYDEDDYPEFPGKLLVHSEEMLNERKYDLTLYSSALLTSTTTFLDPVVITFFKVPTMLLYLYLPRPVNYFGQYKTILEQSTLNEMNEFATKIELNEEGGKRWSKTIRTILGAMKCAPQDFVFTVEEYINPMNGDIHIPPPTIINDDNIYAFNSRIRELMSKAMDLVEVSQKELWNVQLTILNDIYNLKVETQSCYDSIMYDKIKLSPDSSDIQVLCYRSICDIDVLISEKLMPLLGKVAVVSSLGRNKQMYWLPYNDSGNFMRMSSLFNL